MIVRNSLTHLCFGKGSQSSHVPAGFHYNATDERVSDLTEAEVAAVKATYENVEVKRFVGSIDGETVASWKWS